MVKICFILGEEAGFPAVEVNPYPGTPTPQDPLMLQHREGPHWVKAQALHPSRRPLGFGPGVPIGGRASGLHPELFLQGRDAGIGPSVCPSWG